jgi:hypothetical protein
MARTQVRQRKAHVKPPRRRSEFALVIAGAAISALAGTRGKGEVSTGTNHLGFRCVMSFIRAAAWEASPLPTATRLSPQTCADCRNYRM